MHADRQIGRRLHSHSCARRPFFWRLEKLRKISALRVLISLRTAPTLREIAGDCYVEQASLPCGERSRGICPPLGRPIRVAPYHH